MEELTRAEKRQNSDKDFNGFFKATPERVIVDDLLDAGFDYGQIKDAMEDGEYLKKENISQELAEKVHALCIRDTKK